MKDFNTLIDNKSFFDQPVKHRQEAYEKLIEMMNIQEETYYICYIIKIIINSFV